MEKKIKNNINQEKTYPRDVEITPENAMVEIAKDIREIRNFNRDMPRTGAGRFKVAAWDTGFEFRDLLNTVKSIAKKMGIQAKRERIKTAKENREKEKKKLKTIEIH